MIKTISGYSKIFYVYLPSILNMLLSLRMLMLKPGNHPFGYFMALFSIFALLLYLLLKKEQYDSERDIARIILLIYYILIVFSVIPSLFFPPTDLTHPFSFFIAMVFSGIAYRLKVGGFPISNYIYGLFILSAYTHQLSVSLMMAAFMLIQIFEFLLPGKFTQISDTWVKRYNDSLIALTLLFIVLVTIKPSQYFGYIGLAVPLVVVTYIEIANLKKKK